LAPKEDAHTSLAWASSPRHHRSEPQTWGPLFEANYPLRDSVVLPLSIACGVPNKGLGIE
jgi:hypothetical protein